MALHLYLEGMGFRAIGRVLSVSNVTVLQWIKAIGKSLQSFHQQQATPDKVEVIELDEMWHFVRKKSKVWIWFALDRRRYRILNFAVGGRGVETGKQLWEKIKSIECEGYATDYWLAYGRFIKGKHMISKSETCRIKT